MRGPVSLPYFLHGVAPARPRDSELVCCFFFLDLELHTETRVLPAGRDMRGTRAVEFFHDFFLPLLHCDISPVIFLAAASL
jgi:hypothetical protein